MKYLPDIFSHSINRIFIISGVGSSFFMIFIFHNIFLLRDQIFSLFFTYFLKHFIIMLIIPLILQNVKYKSNSNCTNTNVHNNTDR